MKSLIFRSALFSCLLGACAVGCSDGKSATGNTGGSGNAGGAGAGGAGTGGAAPTGDITSHTYGYDDEGIVYSGRILFADGKAPRFSAPAVTISARFKGVSAAMTINDYASSAN